MKKIWKMLLLAATLTVVLSISAFAAEINTGIYDVQSESGVTLTPQKTENKQAVEVEAGSLSGIDGDYYADAERVEVKLSGATEGKFYLIVAMEDDGTGETQYPTENNKPVYINQETASSGSVILNVYPSQMENGETYNVYVSSNDGAAYGSYKKVASFKYHYAEAQAPYTPGDVDNNGIFTSTDALYALQMSVGLGGPWESTQKLAADVTGEGQITSTDALYILQRSVGLITKFPVEG